MKLSRLALFDGSQLAGGQDPARTPPDSILLLKFGPNGYTKGGERGEFEFSEEDADNVVAEFSIRGRDLVVDYEHQTLSGDKAPAAGWISSLEKSAQGLVAKVKYWTDAAKELLSSGEYRYFSPVLCFSRSGRSVSAIHSVALTNHPAMHLAPALVADDKEAAVDPSEASRHRPESGLDKNNSGETEQMNEIMLKLGLLPLADAGEGERRGAVLREIDSLLALKSGLEGLLKLHDCASLEQLAARFAGMVPAAEKEALKKALAERDADAAVAKAFADGKLAERSRAWALSFASRDLAAFKDWSEAAPRIVPDNQGLEAAEPLALDPAIQSQELGVFKTLGLTDAQIQRIMKGI